VRRRAKTCVASILVAEFTCVVTAQAGHIPEVSEHLTGKPVPDFNAVDLDGKHVAFADFRGKPLIINVFASWCPPCQATVRDLRELAPAYMQRGVNIVGVLADAVETPETVAEAKAELERKPLPYPVVLLNSSLKDALAYEGFPATYFVRDDGTFTTTLFGLQPAEKTREVADSLQPLTADRDVTLRTTSAVAAAPKADSWTQPLAPLVPRRWKQWHPMLIHFPIALLIIEAMVFIAHWLRPREELARFAAWLLLLAVISFVPAILTGIADSGVDAGMSFPEALRERTRNFWRVESAVSLHMLYALAAALVASGRLIWLKAAAWGAMRGRQRMAFAAVTLVNLWLLFGAGQAGGGITHA